MADPVYIRKNESIVQGDDLWLFIGTTENEEIPVAFSTNHQLSRSLNTQSVSSKDHGNTSYVIPGEGSWTCSTEALMSIESDDEGHALAFEDLMDAFDDGDKVWVRFGKLTDTSETVDGHNIVNVDGASEWTLDTPNWYGEAYITSLQASGGHGDSATMSIELTGVGPLKKKLTDDYTITKDGDAEEYITLSQLVAHNGETISITPTGAMTYGSAYTYAHVYSNDATITAATGAWSFTMPSRNVTIFADAKNDPELEFSKASATAYMLGSSEYDYHELPILSYAANYTSGVQYSATGPSQYVNDIVFVDDKPTVPSDSSAYAYIWSENGVVEATVVALSYATDDYYSNTAEYQLAVQKQ